MARIPARMQHHCSAAAALGTWPRSGTSALRAGRSLKIHGQLPAARFSTAVTSSIITYIQELQRAFSHLRQALPYLSHAQLVQCSSHFGQPLPEGNACSGIWTLRLQLIYGKSGSTCCLPIRLKAWPGSWRRRLRLGVRTLLAPQAARLARLPAPRYALDYQIVMTGEASPESRLRENLRADEVAPPFVSYRLAAFDRILWHC